MGTGTPDGRRSLSQGSRARNSISTLTIRIALLLRACAIARTRVEAKKGSDRGGPPVRERLAKRADLIVRRDNRFGSDESRCNNRYSGLGDYFGRRSRRTDGESAQKLLPASPGGSSFVAGVQFGSAPSGPSAGGELHRDATSGKR